MANDENAEHQGNHVIVTALSALRWTLEDVARAERLLALTGLSASDLRRGAADPAVLAAVLQFLEGHEPDLLACADALRIDPAELVSARASLEGQAA